MATDASNSTPSACWETIVSEPFGENSYVGWLEGSSQAVVVDPGFEPEKIIECLEAHGLSPAALLITHAHADHIGGNETLKRRWPDCPIVIGRGEAFKLTDAWANLSAAFGYKIVSPPADVQLSEGDVYEAAGFRFEIFEIPGHATGHVVFVWKESSPFVVLGGDVLFAGSIGRTDFPNGSLQVLTEGIHRKLFNLPDDTIVLSGHGPPTTIGREKRTNPFVGRAAGYENLV